MLQTLKQYGSPVVRVATSRFFQYLHAEDARDVDALVRRYWTPEPLCEATALQTIESLQDRFPGFEYRHYLARHAEASRVMFVYETANADHLKRLKRYGPCILHRRSFRPIQKALAR